MPGILKILSCLTLIMPIAAAAQEACGVSERSDVPAMNASNWTVLVSVTPFPAIATDKASYITSRYGDQFPVQVCRFPGSLPTFAVRVGPKGSTIAQAVVLKSSADEKNLGVDVVIWRPKNERPLQVP
jgi:hypothetical protein